MNQHEKLQSLLEIQVFVQQATLLYKGISNKAVIAIFLPLQSPISNIQILMLQVLFAGL